jgi:glycosyltransferase involved in cell wall biosynthesis
VLLFPIRETLLNLCRCPSKTFAYVQAKRPVIANRVGEVAEVLGDKGIYVEPTPQSFADAIERAMSSPEVERDIEYDLSNLTWSARADALLAELKKR